jgi:hypothetical protein
VDNDRMRVHFANCVLDSERHELTRGAGRETNREICAAEPRVAQHRRAIDAIRRV